MLPGHIIPLSLSLFILLVRLGILDRTKSVGQFSSSRKNSSPRVVEIPCLRKYPGSLLPLDAYCRLTAYAERQMAGSLNL